MIYSNMIHGTHKPVIQIGGGTKDCPHKYVALEVDTKDELCTAHGTTTFFFESKEEIEAFIRTMALALVVAEERRQRE